MPINDPFGGWIPWTRLPVATLSRVVLTPQGSPQTAACGPLFGTIAIASRFWDDAPFALLESATGNRLHHQSTLAFAQDSASGQTRLFGGIHETHWGGYLVVPSGQRGPLDQKNALRARSFDTGIRHTLGHEGDWHLTLRTQGWEEHRSNGTPLARNHSKSLDFSLQLDHTAPPDEWSTQATLFHQRRDFASTFTALSKDRSVETLTLDQFAVPTRATGFLHLLRLPLGETHRLALGTDLRKIEGETQELFRNQGAGFTRKRIAGGSQSVAAWTIADTWQVAPHSTLTPSARFAIHSQQNGFLRESDLSSGALLTQSSFPRRRSVPLDLSLTARHALHTSLESETCLFSSNRPPTLNELVRPFRVGSTLTLANPALRPENLRGIETLLRWHPNSRITLRGKLFAHQLRNAVTNVTLVNGPGSFPEWGFLAAGAQGARRENVELVQLQGLECGAEWALHPALTLEVNWRHTRSRILKATIQPSLEGLTPPQTPRHQARWAIRGEHAHWRWNLAARYESDQFDDDQNQRRLASVLCVDAQLTRILRPGTEVFFGIENLGDRPIQARRDADGTLAITTPRSWTLGVRHEF